MLYFTFIYLLCIECTRWGEQLDISIHGATNEFSAIGGFDPRVEFSLRSLDNKRPQFIYIGFRELPKFCVIFMCYVLLKIHLLMNLISRENHNFTLWSKAVLISEGFSPLADSIGYLTSESIMTWTLDFRLLRSLRSPQEDWNWTWFTVYESACEDCCGGKHPYLKYALCRHSSCPVLIVSPIYENATCLPSELTICPLRSHPVYFHSLDLAPWVAQCFLVSPDLWVEGLYSWLPSSKTSAVVIWLNNAPFVVIYLSI